MSDDKKQNDKKQDIDALTGVETTGHEWDGLKELNNPLPRWWLWVFFATCVWSFVYFVLYPAWPVPGGATEGLSGYTQYKELRESQQEIFERQKLYLDQFEEASFEEILAEPGLYAFAMAGGEAAFKDNCATCHGSGAQGSFGYPNLNDDAWLWGGSVEAIHTTLLHGIRVQNDYDTRLSQMPAFGKDGLLSRDEINTVVDYVMKLGDYGSEYLATLPGHTIFQQNCASCHGPDGEGMEEVGSPNLADAIWLYGGDRKTVFESVYNSRAGMMPAWKERLDAQTIRQLAVYVHQLGGGDSLRFTPSKFDKKMNERDLEAPINEEAVEELNEQ